MILSQLKFAKQSGVEIIPCIMQGQSWKATGWLGLLTGETSALLPLTMDVRLNSDRSPTAGCLWIKLADESSFEETVRSQLYGQIQTVIGAGLSLGDNDEVTEVTEVTEVKEELERLRDALVPRADSQSAVATTLVMSDPTMPAAIPAGVPKLPARFQTTAHIRELTRLCLSTEAADIAKPRVGFFGMGGIGKTVTGASIARDPDVRQYFEAIIWLPLGQTPMISKLQNLLFMQCMGTELSRELSSDEKKEALQQAMLGKRVLLCLDDLWEDVHEAELNFADVSAGSKVLISTRMQGLLAGGHQIEVGLPSPSDSARMLLSAADVEDHSREPKGVFEIVELCGRLPLALSIAGRLVASLGLGGAEDWSGMVGVLREELRESHSGGCEEGMIRASLRGLKGSAQEQTSVKSLLLLFALVPGAHADLCNRSLPQLPPTNPSTGPAEDTFCPLEILLLMFQAVNKGSRASMMHIRKWLRVLIDRSLVSGMLPCAQNAFWTDKYCCM